MKDFFISYDEADSSWAEWIAWTLEELGYSAIIKAWDFQPGKNFTLEIQRATATAKATIAVLSKNYLKATSTHPEWIAAFASDPLGDKRRLMPVRVERCEVDGLLGQNVYIDLVGITDKQQARETIISGLRVRKKPAEEPLFPGETLIHSALTEKISLNKRTDKLRSKHNLKSRDYTELIGRKEELTKLLKHISPDYRQHITVIDGIGGVGKTSLVLEAAHTCLGSAKKIVEQSSTSSKEDNLTYADVVVPAFEAIIFTSAKTAYLKVGGIQRRQSTERCLQDIFRTIARTIESSAINHAAAEDQLQKVYDCLSQQSTLLIIDNMEVLENSEKEKVFAFLADLPSSTQAIITTREKQVNYPSISLPQLSEGNSIKLIKQQAAEKGISIDEELAKKLYQRFEGIPVALIYTVGQIADYQSLESILSEKAYLHSDISRFCFEESVQSLKHSPGGNAAHKILMAFSILQGSATRTSLAQVSGLDEDHMAVSDGLSQLQRLSFVREGEDSRYRVLALTREYARLESSRNCDFEAAARDRSVKWCLEFTEQHGGLDWEDWRIRYSNLEVEWTNISGILEWCAAHDRYEDIKGIWQNIDNYVDLSGHWQIRISWLDWLAEQASRRVDLPTYIHSSVCKAWTLLLIGGAKRDEAKSILLEAWKLREHVDPIQQADIARSLAVFDLRHKSYSCTLRWLNCSERLLEEADIKDREHVRYRMFSAYYRSRVSYYEEKYEDANNILEQILSSCNRIGWQRFITYAEHRLGEVAMKEEELQKSRRYLKRALWAAEHNGEQRRVFLCKMSLARLEKACNHLERACALESEATQAFSSNWMTASDREDLHSLHGELGCGVLVNA